MAANSKQKITNFWLVDFGKSGFRSDLCDFWPLENNLSTTVNQIFRNHVKTALICNNVLLLLPSCCPVKYLIIFLSYMYTAYGRWVGMHLQISKLHVYGL